MPTAVDAEPQHRPRHLFRWLVVAVVVVLVALGGALLLRGLGVIEASEPELKEQLAGEVVSVLEAASVDEHADHGHHVAAEERFICEVEVFGFDPPGATTVAEVDVVYAQHMCAVVAPGWEWPAALRAYGPLAVELTEPPRVLLPESVELDDEDALYDDRIRALIPQRYHEPALAGTFSDRSLEEELRDRHRSASR